MKTERVNFGMFPYLREALHRRKAAATSRRNPDTLSGDELQLTV